MPKDIPQSGPEAVGRTSDFTNLGPDKQQTQADVRTADRMGAYRGMNEARFQDYLNEVEHTQKAWTKEEITERSGETSRFKRVAATIAEVVVPVATGTAVDTLIKAAGVAGGPLVSAAVGAASGAVRAAMEYKHVGKEGQNAAEFWQKNVGSRDKKVEEGNFFQRGWGVVSRFMKGGSYLAVEAGFKVKERDERIQQFMYSINLETNKNGTLLKDPNAVLQKLERKYGSNPEEFKTFVKDLMIQSVLSNFSEQKTTAEQKQMSDIFCIANALLYNADSQRLTNQYHSLAAAQRAHHEPTETINKLWKESREEIKDTISRTQAYFIIGSATERAVKSVVGFYAVKWVAQGIAQLSELKTPGVATDQMRDAKDVIAHTDNDIKNTKQNISDLKDQISHLNHDSVTSEPTAVDYKTILEPAAKASGQDIDTYLSIGERSDRINSIPEVVKALQDQDALNHIQEISQHTGLKPEEILNSEILRWGYDSKSYGSFAEMLEKAADNDPRAIASLRQAYIASKNVSPVWNDLAKKLLENAQDIPANGNLDQLQSLQEQLISQQDHLNTLVNTNVKASHILKELQNSANLINTHGATVDIWDVSKRGIGASVGAIVDILSGSQAGNYMYGERNRFTNRRRPTPQPGPNTQTGPRGNANTGPQPRQNTQTNPRGNTNTGPQPRQNTQTNPRGNANTGPQTGPRPNTNTGQQTGQRANTGQNVGAAQYFGFDANATDETEKKAYKFVNYQETLSKDIRDRLTRGQHIDYNDVIKIIDWLNNEGMLTNWNQIYRKIMAKAYPGNNTTLDPRTSDFVRFMNNFNDEVFKRYQRRQPRP